jgi:hypothetical protein
LLEDYGDYQPARPTALHVRMVSRTWAYFKLRRTRSTMIIVALCVLLLVAIVVLSWMDLDSKVWSHLILGVLVGLVGLVFALAGGRMRFWGLVLLAAGGYMISTYPVRDSPPHLVHQVGLSTVGAFALLQVLEMFTHGRAQDTSQAEEGPSDAYIDQSGAVSISRNTAALLFKRPPHKLPSTIAHFWMLLAGTPPSLTFPDPENVNINKLLEVMDTKDMNQIKLDLPRSAGIDQDKAVTLIFDYSRRCPEYKYTQGDLYFFRHLLKHMSIAQIVTLLVRHNILPTLEERRKVIDNTMVERLITPELQGRPQVVSKILVGREEIISMQFVMGQIWPEHLSEIFMTLLLYNKRLFTLSYICMIQKLLATVPLDVEQIMRPSDRLVAYRSDSQTPPVQLFRTDDELLRCMQTKAEASRDKQLLNALIVFLKTVPLTN